MIDDLPCDVSGVIHHWRAPLEWPTSRSSHIAHSAHISLQGSGLVLGVKLCEDPSRVNGIKINAPSREHFTALASFSSRANLSEEEKEEEEEDIRGGAREG